MARLILNRDGVDLGTHELVPDMVMIGRAPMNHIVIDDPTVSAHHARLLRAADSYWLADLHSTTSLMSPLALLTLPLVDTRSTKTLPAKQTPR
jgi:hypothetical protein